MSRSTTDELDTNEMSFSDTGEGQSASDALPFNPGDSVSRKTLTTEQDKALDNICRVYKIHPDKVNYLLELKKFEIVIVVDDSGSMDTLIEGTTYTRWDEVRKMVKIIVDVATIFDKNGVDIYFLNSQDVFKVKDAQMIDSIFQEISPYDYTPMVRVLEKVFTSNYARKGRDKKLLVFVATDGQPTDDEGDENLEQFKRTMKETRNQETTYVSFLLCTDVPEYAELFTEYDRSMSNIDVIDDYETEKVKVSETMGPNHRFDYGDYIVKALVGSFIPELDRINDRCPTNGNR